MHFNGSRLYCKSSGVVTFQTDKNCDSQLMLCYFGLKVLGCQCHLKGKASQSGSLLQSSNHNQCDKHISIRKKIQVNNNQIKS